MPELMTADAGGWTWVLLVAVVLLAVVARPRGEAAPENEAPRARAIVRRAAIVCAAASIVWMIERLRDSPGGFTNAAEAVLLFGVLYALYGGLRLWAAQDRVDGERGTHPADAEGDRPADVGTQAGETHRPDDAVGGDDAFSAKDDATANGHDPERRDPH